MKNMLVRVIILVSLCLSLSSCGTKFFYRNLDLIIPWYVDDYVNLTDAQEDFLDRALGNHLSWHRKKQLPLYVNYLDHLANLIQNPTVSEDDINQIQDDGREFYQAILKAIKGDLITILKQLNTTQQQSLFSELVDKNEEFFEESVELDDKEYTRQRMKNVKRRFKAWFGSPSDTQIQLLEDWVSQLTRTDHTRHFFHINWQNALRDVYTSNDLEQRVTKLDMVITKPDNYYPSGMEAMLDQNRQISANYLQLVHKTLSHKQVQHFLRELNDLKQDLKDLLAESP